MSYEGGGNSRKISISYHFRFYVLYWVLKKLLNVYYTIKSQIERSINCHTSPYCVINVSNNYRIKIVIKNVPYGIQMLLAPRLWKFNNTRYLCLAMPINSFILTRKMILQNILVLDCCATNYVVCALHAL